VVFLFRLLILLIVVRILVPPCMCLCKLEAPASRAIAWVFGTEVPDAPMDYHDDDHHPGCPASYLSLGLGLQPMPFIEPLPSSLSLPAPTPFLPATTLVVPVSISAMTIGADPPLYVSHCALTI
jgi:hypothetical protein